MRAVPGKLQYSGVSLETVFWRPSSGEGNQEKRRGENQPEGKGENKQKPYQLTDLQRGTILLPASSTERKKKHSIEDRELRTSNLTTTNGVQA